MSQQEQTIGTNNINKKLWAVSDFKIISETWDKHKTKDGSLLKARVILTSVRLETSLNEIEARVRAGEKPKIGLTFRTKNNIQTKSLEHQLLRPTQILTLFSKVGIPTNLKMV